MRTRSSQCHNNPVLVTTCKPPDHVKYFHDSQTYDVKKLVDVWIRMDVVQVEDGILSQTFHLTMYFFQFVTGVNFKWYYVMWCIIALLVWIVPWIKLRICRLPLDPGIWSCRFFGFLLRAFMMNWMLCTKNDLKLSHINQVNTLPNMKLATSLIFSLCHTCRIFEGF